MGKDMVNRVNVPTLIFAFWPKPALWKVFHRAMHCDEKSTCLIKDWSFFFKGTHIKIPKLWKVKIFN
jgi:hypothetical protein